MSLINTNRNFDRRSFGDNEQPTFVAHGHDEKINSREDNHAHAQSNLGANALGFAGVSIRAGGYEFTGKHSLDLDKGDKIDINRQYQAPTRGAHVAEE